MDTDVAISIEGDEVVVIGPSLLRDRLARMYFRSILGASQTQTGWRCPRRGSDTSTLVVQINTFLERKGWRPHREGRADDLVERELERRRSFTRTREHAIELREGRSLLDIEGVLGRLREFGWKEANRTLKEHQRVGLTHALTAANAANFSVPWFWEDRYCASSRSNSSRIRNNRGDRCRWPAVFISSVGTRVRSCTARNASSAPNPRRRRCANRSI